jgi:hypothetical protein
MERTVPRTTTEEIDLYLRTMYSLLRSSTEVQIRTLEEVHSGMNSSLHPNARSSQPDLSAFVYSLLRLPDCISQVRTVILGQSAEVFSKAGYGDVEKWEPVSARARRRRCYFDRDDTLAAYIASRSDIEDLIPAIVAYQIEWNKIHELLATLPVGFTLSTVEQNPAALNQLAQFLQISIEDLNRLRTIWGGEFLAKLTDIQGRTCELRIRLLSGALSDYWRATRAWWENIERAFPSLLERPVYFISSNTHSIINLLTGYAQAHRDELIQFLEKSGRENLRAEWAEIQTGKVPSNRQNFLYYLLKVYQQSPEGKHLLNQQLEQERGCCIRRVYSEHYFDVDAQVIDLFQLDPAVFDPRLSLFSHSTAGEWNFLQKSDALILNIDYPLGLAAYNILTKVAEHCMPVLGVYMVGKAATLNGVMGDVMIPNVVQDEQSQNTYLFRNVFHAADVLPYLVYGTVLDNQKSVTVLGTFLQNPNGMDVIYREGYTDIEMEGGPYLSAIYEMYRPKRHPVNEIVNLYELPFDLGMLHYASDTPLSKGKNLGAGTLSYYGMDSTYACSLAVLRRIFELERRRIE